MTTAYGPISLPSLSSPGPEHSYVNRIPASDLIAGDLYTTLTLVGPSSGLTRIQSMWIGHPAGSGLDFDGNQVQVRLAGQTSFSLIGSSSVNLDPVGFQIDNTKDLLIAYRIPSGDLYSFNGSAGPGHSQSWKQGTEDPGLTIKSGYTINVGRTAIVAGISVAPTNSVEPPDGNEDCCSHLDALLAGELQSSGGEVASFSGRLHFMLMNPSNSGRNGFLHQIVVTSDADTTATVRSYQTPLATTLPKSNLMFGRSPGLMELTYSFNPTLLGDFHSIVTLRGSEPYKINAPFPLVGIPPGTGVLLAIHGANVGATCNFEWQEKPV